MRFFVLPICAMVCLATLIRAQPDAVGIKAYEGQKCQTSTDCLYKDYHRCTGPVTGCQPYLGYFRAPCATDNDCQFGLRCKQDPDISEKDILKHIAAGGLQSQKVNVTKLMRCYADLPSTPHRLNPVTGNPANGVEECDSDADCEGKEFGNAKSTCIFGVCIIQPGVEWARCESPDWCKDGMLCVNGAYNKWCYKTKPESDMKGSGCTARGLGCWSDSSCCDGNCIYGPFFGLPKQCAFK